MIKRFMNWLSTPKAAQWQDPIESMDVQRPILMPGQRRFLKEHELPEACEYASFCIGGMIEGRGLAVWVVERKIFNG